MSLPAAMGPGALPSAKPPVAPKGRAINAAVSAPVAPFPIRKPAVPAAPTRTTPKFPKPRGSSGNAIAADHVIVGGGTAGCVLAARLSENPGVSVLLIEAGGEDRNPLLAVPGGMALIRDWSREAWELAVEPDASRAGHADQWRRVRGPGGSSRLNGLLWARGLPSDYDRWAAVDPYFAKAERVSLALPVADATDRSASKCYARHTCWRSGSSTAPPHYKFPPSPT